MTTIIQKLYVNIFAGLATERRPHRYPDPQREVKWKRCSGGFGVRRGLGVGCVRQQQQQQAEKAKETGWPGQDLHFGSQVPVHPGQVVPGGKDLQARLPFHQAEVSVIQCGHPTSQGL